MMLGDAPAAVALPANRWPWLWALLGVGGAVALYIALKPEGSRRRSD